MKRNIVREIIEKKLSPYGFKYVGNKHSRWVFCRTVNKVVQEVVIQKSNWGNSYLLEANSMRIKTIMGDPFQQDYLEYNSEIEQQKVLNELGDIAIYYGLKKLEEVCTPQISYDPSVEMQQKLFADNESLTHKFLERYKYSSLDEPEILQAVQWEMRCLHLNLVWMGNAL